MIWAPFLHNDTLAIPLVCPLDATPLQRHDRQWRCQQGHSFDIARQGYVNLLPVQHKRSRDPGDSKAMIAARRAFLDSGVYQAVANHLAELVDRHLPPAPARVLDAGCGEGYYLQQLSAQLAGRAIAWAGLDISKWAVMAAAKRLPQATWLVASNRQIPLAPHSLDLLLCCFGFASYDAFARVLKAGGKVILVDAGSDHLVELRQVIYEDVKRSPLPSLAAAEAVGFKLVESKALRYQTEPLNRQQLQQLLTMTPHLYRASAEGKAAADALQSLALTVDVTFRVLTI